MVPAMDASDNSVPLFAFRLRVSFQASAKSVSFLGSPGSQTILTRGCQKRQPIESSLWGGLGHSKIDAITDPLLRTAKAKNGISDFFWGGKSHTTSRRGQLRSELQTTSRDPINIPAIKTGHHRGRREYAGPAMGVPLKSVPDQAMTPSSIATTITAISIRVKSSVQKGSVWPYLQVCEPAPHPPPPKPPIPSKQRLAAALSPSSAMLRRTPC